MARDPKLLHDIGHKNAVKAIFVVDRKLASVNLHPKEGVRRSEDIRAVRPTARLQIKLPQRERVVACKQIVRRIHDSKGIFADELQRYERAIAHNGDMVLHCCQIRRIEGEDRVVESRPIEPDSTSVIVAK